MAGTVKALVGCQIEGCAEEVSYHLDMVRMFKGKPICQSCLEDSDHNFITYDEATDQYSPDWHELPEVSMEDLRP